MLRRQIIIVVALTLAGVAIGDCCAMLTQPLADQRAEVKLERSMPAATVGGLFGLILGLVTSTASCNSRRSQARVTVLAAIVLSGSIGAQFGWISGDNSNNRVGGKGMLIGAIIGCVVGAALGITQYNDDRYSKAANDETTAKD
jgi:hypothetical protein